MYSAITIGIYIQDIYGNLYSEDEWDGTQTVNGVAVTGENCSFVIGLDSNSLAITGEGSGSLDDYMTSNYFEDNNIPESALNDYNGEANTANILKAESSADYAAGWCNSFISPNGKKGFLPALGQLLTIFNNLSKINNALSALNVSEIDYKKKYFSSTYYGIMISSEYMYAYGKSNDTDELIFYVISPTENNTIIPIFPLVQPEDIITFVAAGITCKCVKGTTWERWCSSAFKENGFGIQDGFVTYAGVYYITLNDVQVSSTSEIIAGTRYGVVEGANPPV